MSCPKAQEQVLATCWPLELYRSYNKLLGYGFQHLMFHLLHTLPLQQKNRLVVTLWSIWKARNQKVWENSKTQPTTAIHLFMQYLAKPNEMAKTRARIHEMQSGHKSVLALACAYETHQLSLHKSSNMLFQWATETCRN